MKKFIVCIDDSTAAQRDAITTYLKSGDFGYWHWFQHAWFICDPTDKWTAASLREKLREHSTTASLIVLQLGNDHSSTWAGYGTPNQFDWFKTNWDKK